MHPFFSRLLLFSTLLVSVSSQCLSGHYDDGNKDAGDAPTCPVCGNGGSTNYICASGSYKTGTACTGTDSSDTQTCGLCGNGGSTNYICASGSYKTGTACTGTDSSDTQTCGLCHGGTSYHCLAGTKRTGSTCTGSGVADTQTCVGCSSGQYQSSDSFVGTACTPHAVPLCTNASGTYASASPSTTTDRVCTIFSTCGKGQRETQAPTTLNNRLCSSCDNGEYQSTNGYTGTTCTPWLNCAAEEYQSTPPSTSVNRVCTTWSKCLAGTYETTAPTSTLNRVCSSCDAGRYQESNSFTGTTCAPWSTCTAGQKGTAPTLSLDRVCSHCDAGQYHPTDTTQVTSCSNCESGKYQEQIASSTCNFCAAGTAFTSSTTTCATCVAGQYQTKNDLASAICLTCNAGFSTRNRSVACEACPIGQSQGLATAVDYNSCALCPKGKEYINVDELCSTCANGQFQLHHEKYRGAKCCPTFATTQSQDFPKCKSITITLVKSSRAASDGQTIGLPTPPEGIDPVFNSTHSYRGTDILNVEITLKNFDNANEEVEDHITSLFVWVVTESDPSVPLFEPVIVAWDGASATDAEAINVNVAVPMISEVETTFSVLDGQGGTVSTTSKLCSAINRRTVIVVTDKKDLSWTPPETVFQSSTTDKHHDNTKVIGYYNEPALVFFANEIPSIPSSDVYVKPNLIFESTTIVTCQVNALDGRQLGSYASHIRDRDSPNRQIDGVAFSNNDGDVLLSLTTATLNPISQYAPDSATDLKLGTIGCRITGYSDGCATSTSPTNSTATVVVSPLLLTPKAGSSLGGNTIVVQGSGFALDDQNQDFTMTFDDLDEDISDRRESITVRCHSPTTSTSIKCTAPLFDKSAAAKVTLKGPIVAYKGCYLFSDWKKTNPLFIGNPNAGLTIQRFSGGLSSCQNECHQKSLNAPEQYDLFALIGSDCWCGRSSEWNNGIVPKDGRECATRCVSPFARPSFEEIGCYELSITSDIIPDLPVVGDVSQIMNHTKCSQKCEGYDYFGVVGSSRCFCGDAFHRDPSKTTPVDDDKCDAPCVGDSQSNTFCGGGKFQSTFRQSTALSSSRAKESFRVDDEVSPGARCGQTSVVESEQRVSVYEVRTERIMQAENYEFGKGPATAPRNVRMVPIKGGMMVWWMEPLRLGGYNDVNLFDWHISYGVSGANQAPPIVLKLSKGSDLTAIKDGGDGCTNANLQPGEVRRLVGNSNASVPVASAGNPDWDQNCGNATSDEPCPCTFNQDCFYDTWCTVIRSTNLAADLLFEAPIKYKGTTLTKQYKCPCDSNRKNEADCKVSDVIAQCDAGSIRCDHYCSTASAARAEDISKSTTSNELAHDRTSSGTFVDFTKEYEVKVLAENAAGGNVFSLPALSMRRDPNNVATFLNSPLPPSVPSNGNKPFAEVPAEANLIYLKWHAPDNRGSPVTHFLIETERLNDIGESACYSIDEIRVEATIEEREMGTLSFINANGMIENTATAYTVAHTQPLQEAMAIYPWEAGATGFKSATPYKFRIKAVNSVGSGEWSDLFKWRTEDETLPKTILGSNDCPVETADSTLGCFNGNESLSSSNATFNAFTTLATAMEWMAPGRLLPSYVKGCNLFDQAMGRGGQVMNLRPSHAHHVGPHERCFKSARAQLIGVGGSSQTTINCGGHRCFVSGFVEKTKQWMFASVIKGVTFVNGSSSTYGGFLYIYGFSETFGMQIEDVVFQGGHAAVMGGAVFLEHCYVDPNVLATGKIIISATFIDNHANKFGGAIAVLSSDAVVVDRSVFRGSSSLESGGALVMGPLKKRRVAGSNVADWTCSIETCVCEKDDPLRLETDACPFVKVDEQFTEQRGAVVVNNTNFFDSQVESVAGGLGGVIFLEEADIVLENSLFRNNQVNQVLGLGGCLYARSAKTSVRNSQFMNNIAGGGGSICAVASSLEVESSLFFNNTGMQVGGGAIQSFFSDVVLKHNTISNNIGKYGGGVYVGPSTSFVSQLNQWVQNSAEQFGGALHCEGAESANVDGDNFTQNVAGCGGAMSAIETSNVHVHSKTIFQKNVAAHDEGGGGAIYIDLRESDVAVRWNLKPLIASCVFLDNKARGVGTGILWTACDRTMGNSSLLPLVNFQYSYNNTNLIASTSQKLKLVPANGTKHYERSASTFATPWSLQVLDFYDKLSVISNLEVTVRSVTKMNEVQCSPFHGVNYDLATQICHFQQFNQVVRAVKGLATFSDFKINALPTALFEDVPLDVEFVLNLDTRSDTWLNRMSTQLYIESCTPGEVINPTDRKCLQITNGHFASTYNHNAWLMKASPEVWLSSDKKQWNTSCPVGTYGDGKRIPWKKWEKVEFGTLASCQLCPAGYFNDMIESNECKVCVVGTYGQYVGAEICLFCPKGKFSDAEQLLECKACPSGQYRHADVDQSCLACPSGFWTAWQEDKGECDECSAGMFGMQLTDAPTQKKYGKCLDCEFGMFSPPVLPQGISVRTACSNCQAGQWTGVSLSGEWSTPYEEIKCISSKQERCGDDEGLTGIECRDLCAERPTCYRHHFLKMTEAETSRFIISRSSSDKSDRSDNQTASTRGNGTARKNRCLLEGMTTFHDVDAHRKVGQPSCRTCRRGEISQPGMANQCSQCESSSRKPSTEVTELSGQYNFYQKKKKCLRCPLGSQCYNGIKIEVGWGWWVSRGTDAGRQHIKNVFSMVPSNHSSHQNIDLCPWLKEEHDQNIESKESTNEYHDFQCDKPCRFSSARTDGLAEEGCVCRRKKSDTPCLGVDENLDGNNNLCTCERKCTTDKSKTPWSSTFFDACGSYRRLVRCDGYRVEKHCGTIQQQVLEQRGTIFDQNGFSWLNDEKNGYFKLPLHCQSCRRTRIHSIRSYNPKSSRGFSGNVHNRSAPSIDAATMATAKKNDTATAFPADRYVLVTYTLAGSRTKTYEAIIDAAVNQTMLEIILSDSKDGGLGNEGSSPCNVFAGYTGKRCKSCMEGYMKQLDGTCAVCPNLEFAWLALAGCVLAGFVFLAVFVKVTMAGAGSDKKSGAIQKILLNFLQLVGGVSSVPAKWPFYSQTIMASYGSVSMLGDELFPIDCMMPKGTNSFLMKQLVLAVLPIFIVATLALFWKVTALVHLAKKQIHGSADVRHLEVSEIMKVRHAERLAEFKLSVRATAAVAVVEDSNSKRKNSSFAGLGMIEAEHAHRTKVQNLTKLVQEKQHHHGHIHLGKRGISLDHQARAVMHAREFMDFVHENHINLKEIWRKYDKKGEGEIKTSEFYTVLKGLGFRWTDDEFNAVLFLFDGENQDGMIDLATLTQFGRTYWEKFLLSCTSALVLLYPTLLTTFFKLIACEGDMYDGKTASSTYSMYDLNVECFVVGGVHMDYVLNVGVPLLLLYVLGLPILMFIVIRRAQGHINDETSTENHDSLRYRYGLLMAGYRDDMFAWDIIINLRKACMSLVITFGSFTGPDGQLYFSILIFGIFLCAQVAFKPYSNKILNQMEVMSLAIVFFSLYFGTTYFYQKWNGNKSALLISSIVLIGIQGLFVLYLLKHLIEDGGFLDSCSSKRTGEAFALKKKKVKGTNRKTKVKPKTILQMAMYGVSSSGRNEQKRNAKRELQKIIASTKDSKVDKQSMLEMKQNIEDACEIAEKIGVFDGYGEDGKLWLAAASRAMKRLDTMLMARDELLHVHDFHAKTLDPLFPSHSKGKGKLPADGCVEVVECLIAMTGIQHFDENGFKHHHPIRERWDMLCLDFKDFISKKGDEKTNIDKALRVMNPLNIQKDIAVGSGHRLVKIDPIVITKANTACGAVFTYLCACLELQDEYTSDLAYFERCRERDELLDSVKKENNLDEKSDTLKDLQSWTIGAEREQEQEEGGGGRGEKGEADRTTEEKDVEAVRNEMDKRERARKKENRKKKKK